MESLERLRVLLVEDDRAQSDHYRQVLESEGFIVGVEESAEEGIARAAREDFCVIISDNILPGMTGLRSVVEYAQVTKAPVILVASRCSEDLAKDGLLVGAACVLAKPIDGHVLLTVIGAALQKSSRG